MALVPVTHKPIAAHARQFDGSLEAFLDILNARPKSNVWATCTFDADGDFTGLQLSGDSVSLQLVVGDWAVFPDDLSEQPTSMSDALAQTLWQA